MALCCSPKTPGVDTVSHQQVARNRDPLLLYGQAQKSLLIGDFCVKFKMRKSTQL